MLKRPLIVGAVVGMHWLELIFDARLANSPHSCLHTLMDARCPWACDLGVWLFALIDGQRSRY